LKSQDKIFALCDQMRETSFSLHRYLRHGHLEKVYETGYKIDFASFATFCGYKKARKSNF